MAISDLIKDIIERGKFSNMRLAKRLGHKRADIVSMYKAGSRFPKHITLLRILDLAMELGIECPEDYIRPKNQAPVSRK